MARPKIQPKDEARPFGIEELFFSTTDRHGVIRSGNEVFLRVSGYGTMDALVGQPHNIIRHPDVPRAVFKLLWDTISVGRTICAYVKNMAKDGCYYWVIALVTPIEDGYLSVRFKPSSPVLDAVRGLYREMLAAEREAGDSPEQRRIGMQRSGELLARRLGELGYRSYDEFMQTFLVAEFNRRRATMAERDIHAGEIRHTLEGQDPLIERALASCLAIERHFDDRLARSASVVDVIGQMNAASDFLRDLSGNVNLISLNAVIVAHRLGEAGRGLTVITGDLSRVSERGTLLVKQMNEHIAALVDSLRETSFVIATAKLQVEMAIYFARELMNGVAGASAAPSARTLADLQMLVESLSRSISKLVSTLPPARELVRILAAHNEDLSETLRTLSSVQVLGRVEASQLRDQEQFGVLFLQIQEQLDTAQTQMRVLCGLQDEASDHVMHVVRFSKRVQSALGAFRDSFRVAA